jgi:hypothetical protein
LEFKDKVDKMRDRFVVEGITGDSTFDTYKKVLMARVMPAFEHKPSPTSTAK